MIGQVWLGTEGFFYVLSTMRSIRSASKVLLQALRRMARGLFYKA